MSYLSVIPCISFYLLSRLFRSLVTELAARQLSHYVHCTRVGEVASTRDHIELTQEKYSEKQGVEDVLPFKH